MKKQNHNSAPCFWLDISPDKGPQETFNIGPSGVLIGRSPHCDITLPDDELAAQHARITPKNGFCYLQSLQTSEALEVNGQRTRYTCLRNGDVIRLADSQFVFHCSGGPANRQTRHQEEQQRRAFQETSQKLQQQKQQNPPIHPLAVAAILFVALGSWFWAFGLAAIVLGFFSLFEIRSRRKHRGQALALAVICAGFVVSGIDAYQRSGGLDFLLSPNNAAASCKTNLRGIATALRNYAENNQGRMPDNLETLYPDYITDAAMLHCPAAHSRAPGEGYLFPASNMEHPPPETILIIDDAPRHRNGTGGFMLRANGKVEWLASSNLNMNILHSKEKMAR